MLSIDGALELLNDNKREPLPFIWKWRDIYYRMSIHIDGICPIFEANVQGEKVLVYRNTWFRDFYNVNYQYIFDAFLFARYDREPATTRNWRYATYKPYTQDPFQRAIQTITGAIFQDSGYQLTIDNKNDNDYIWGDNFEGKDLISYVSEKFQNICNDPNGIFITIPHEPYYNTTTQNVEPKIYFIPSRLIHHITKDEVVFDCEGYSWLVNNIGYFRFTKDEDGEFIHVDARYGGYYAHMMGRVPMMVAGGIWNTQGYYESWLKAARPIADEYVIGMSDEQMVMKQASFPWITVADSECPSCDNGWLQICTSCREDSSSCSCGVDHSTGSNLKRIDCQRCGGTGRININPGDVQVAPAEEMGNPLVRIDSSPVEINKLHIERNQGLYKSMLSALHLNYIEQAQSGVAKDKDMETRYQFMLKISNDLFERLIRGFVRDIISLRNVSVNNNGETRPLTQNLDALFTIVKPTQFDIYTSYDVIEEYKLARESGLPIFQLNEILDDFTDKRFGGNYVLRRKTYLINKYDMLATMNYADISIVLLNNGATDRDLQYHLRLPLILDQIVTDKGDEWFLNKPDDVIKAEIDRMFESIKPVIPTVEPEQITETRVDV